MRQPGLQVFGEAGVEMGMLGLGPQDEGMKVTGLHGIVGPTFRERKSGRGDWI